MMSMKVLKKIEVKWCVFSNMPGPEFFGIGCCWFGFSGNLEFILKSD